MNAWRKNAANNGSPKTAPLTQQGRRESAPPPPAAPKIDGDPQLWVTLQKVTAGGWVKTTRAMQTPAGVLVNTCSRRQGQNVAAEALVLVPGCTLREVDRAWQITRL